MEPEIQPQPSELPPAESAANAVPTTQALFCNTHQQDHHPLRWILIGNQGLRAGWSAVLFIILTILLTMALGSAASLVFKHVAHVKAGEFTPATVILQESITVLAILGAGAFLAFVEGRRIVDYNLRGAHRIRHFLGGMAAGFAALSALVGALAWGGWLHFGAVTLSGRMIFGYALLWGVAFLGTGLFEEGSFRCYLLSTLTRGINFWWASGTVALCCLDLMLRVKGNGVWGVYAAALLGVSPCLVLHMKRNPGSGFWMAAWVTSTLFGFLHTTNNGENWIGIFAAAAIGFAFCVSVRLTGSAWWAIGCHAAWDWAESFFYGTADSGMQAKGHFLSSAPAGNALWSGGTDGPEGSLLVLGIIALLLVALVVMYGGKATGVATEQIAG